MPPAAARVAKRRAHAFRLLGLAAAGSALVALAYRQPFTYHIEVGGDDASYIEGFQERQALGDSNWRWSDGWSRLHFHNAGQLVHSPRLRVRLLAFRASGDAPPEVTFALNGRVLAAFEAPRTMRVVQVPVEHGELGSGDGILSISTPAAERRGARQLGLRVDWAELTSEPGPPPWRTTAAVLLSALCLYALLARFFNAGLAGYLCLGALAVCSGGLAWAREGTVAALPIGCSVLALLLVLDLARASGLPARMRTLAAPRLLPFFALAVALCSAGQMLLSVRARGAGMILLLAGLAALATLPSGPDETGNGLSARTERTAIVAIALLALAFRLYRLEEIPFAIFRDEARHGSLAREILAGAAPSALFLGPPINQPSPYFFALAAAFQLLGPTLHSLRMVSALAGAAAVPAVWWLVREVVGARVALLGAFGLAISSWHVSISRFSVNYVEPTLLTVPACLFLFRGLRGGRLSNFALCGALAGLAQYASHTAKAVFLVLAASALDELWVRWRAGERARFRRLILGCAIGSATCISVVAPILREVYRSPDQYASRMRQVSIWDDSNAQARYPIDRLASNLRGYLGAFNVEGDANGRHHLPGAPLLDPLFATGLAIGVVLLRGQLGQARYRFLVYWALGSLMPGLVTVDAPTATRIIEAAPALYAISALGIVICWRRGLALGLGPGTLRAVGGALLVAALGYNAWTYFVAMYRSPSVWVKFAPVSTKLGLCLREWDAAGRLGANPVLYAPSAFLEHPDERLVLRFFMPQLEVRAFDDGSFDPRSGDLVVLPNYKDLWRLAAMSSPRDVAQARAADADLARWRAQLESLISAASVTGPSFPATSDPTFWLYELH